MNLDLFGGAVMIFLGILCLAGSAKIAKMWWAGMPSVQEAVSGTSKEEMFRRRAFHTKLIGVAVLIIGVILVIKGFFWS
tara:strand:+ start:360 stop:596 length:237 start_codon:yes stop_codon:yes gene_type:complete